MFQIVGLCIIETTLLDSVLSIINPSANNVGLSVNPDTGNDYSIPNSHLVIKQFNDVV